jgi:hypothetical protein
MIKLFEKFKMIEPMHHRILSSIFFCLSFILFCSLREERNNLRRHLLQEIGPRNLAEAQVIQSKKKPIIYTFYHHIDGTNGGGTGMDSKADDVLLKIWREEWMIAGWIPRVLTMEDARQNPYFKTLDRMLDGLPFQMYDVRKILFLSKKWRI